MEGMAQSPDAKCINGLPKHRWNSVQSAAQSQGQRHSHAHLPTGSAHGIRVQHSIRVLAESPIPTLGVLTCCHINATARSILGVVEWQLQGNRLRISESSEGCAALFPRPDHSYTADRCSKACPTRVKAWGASSGPVMSSVP